ncbi:MAG: ABC transporter substrate-binding protein [Azoarcus sp.]|nr:ABC transporter substrate-binding protein [Azoarcus sp.]
MTGALRHITHWLGCIPLLCLLLSVDAAAAERQHLRVQLQWHHQSQFTGFYVAHARRHFEVEGLDVQFVEGGPGIDPVERLQAGKADIAIAWLDNAWERSTPDRPVTNVAQIFSGSALAVVCRMSAGVLSAQDMIGRRVGVWNIGDEAVVAEMIRRLGFAPGDVELVTQRPDGTDLIDGVVPCATVMTYNEYWRLLDADIPEEDLLVINPGSFGLPHIEDGLYVDGRRLDDPAFVDALARFVRAARLGWQEARSAPTLAVETVMRIGSGLEREQQRHMLETALALVPDDNRFGQFDLAAFEIAREHIDHGDGAPPPDGLWTHAVWNALQALDGRDRLLSTATQHYARSILDMALFQWLVLLGVMTFALSGALEAVNRGYDFYGRLILAFLSGLGGGTLRDLLIGGERQPLFYITDPAYPAGILLVVVAATVLTAIRPDIHHTRSFTRAKHWTDVIGFSVLAASGATIAIAHDMPWYWAPFCAAMTCAGGGVLREIVINREPATLKGVIYEEVAIFGGLLLVGALVLANHFEQSPWPVYAAMLFAIAAMIAARLIILRRGLRYPQWLGGKPQAQR